MGREGVTEITVNGEEEMKTKKAVLLVTSYLLLVTITGCGYTTRSMISTKFRTIYVTPFVNKVDITNEIYTSTKYKI